MKSLVLIEPGQLSLADDEEAPVARAGEALVRPRRVGICGTDLHAFVGKQPFFSYPRVLGHELGVEVVAIGASDDELAPGDICAVEPYLNCGRCIACRRERPNCCVELRVLGVHTDGGLRELIAVPVNKLHKSSTLALDQLALVEPLSIGAHAVSRARFEPEEFVLIVGAGPIGLAVAQFARLAAAQVVVMDVSQSRLEFCERMIDVRAALTPGENVIAELESITNGDLPTVVFDATGNQHSMAAAFDYVAHSGQLIFVGLFQGEVSFADPNFHRRELTLMSSRNATATDFRNVMQLLESGEIDITPWISHRTALADAAAEFPTWIQRQSNFLKAIIEL